MTSYSSENSMDIKNLQICITTCLPNQLIKTKESISKPMIGHMPSILRSWWFKLFFAHLWSLIQLKKILKPHCTSDRWNKTPSTKTRLNGFNVYNKKCSQQREISAEFPQMAERDFLFFYCLGHVSKSDFIKLWLESNNSRMKTRLRKSRFSLLQ